LQAVANDNFRLQKLADFPQIREICGTFRKSRIRYWSGVLDNRMRCEVRAYFFGPQVEH
jgi:hypothetical protein